MVERFSSGIAWAQQEYKSVTNAFFILDKAPTMDYPFCEHKSCINWKEGNCALKAPEKNGNSCLDFEDAMDSLRLKADAIKGTLS